MTQINRAYLKLREQLQTYLYTLIYRAQVGEPILRPLFLEFPHEQVNYTPQVGHEFMLGPNLLISPIVNGREDGNGNSRKDNLYLPNHRTMWVDLFDGKSTWADAFIISSLTHPGIYQYLYEAALFLTSANATMSSTLKARVKWLLTMITAITTIQETM